MSAAELLQQHRHARGLTQVELADRAGVSRALVSAVESGRHLPRVDAALALACALGTTAERLFGPEPSEPIDALTGEAPAKGIPIRIGFVGGRMVTARPRLAGDGWEVVDGTMGSLDPALLRSGEASVVIAGCEPSLVAIERLLRDEGTRAVAISSSSDAALSALAAGRLHAAVTHFPHGSMPEPEPSGSLRIHLARWRVGLAAAPGAEKTWWRDALEGRTPVIQREPGASAQGAFERASSSQERPIRGPVARSHLDAARQCVAMCLPAVTIEPAAAAVGAIFHPLETHEVELRVATDRSVEPGVQRLLDLLTRRPLRTTLESIGGYDLDGLGSRAS